MLQNFFLENKIQKSCKPWIFRAQDRNLSAYIIQMLFAGITSIQRMEPANSFTMEAAKGTKTILKAFKLAKADVLSTFPFPSKKTLNLNFASLLWMKAQSKS